MEHLTETENHGHHITQPKTYFIAYLALLVLMAATIGAWKVDLGPLNNVIAMAIAVVKATIVVLIFMQVKYSSKLAWLWASIGFIWLFFLFGTLTDYFTRYWVPDGIWPKQ